MAGGDGNMMKGKKHDGPVSGMCVGAHVSMAGGLYNAITNSASINARAVACFLTNQKTWNVKPLTEKEASVFKEYCVKYDYPSHLILPHASYLVNCGSPKPDVLEKSRTMLTDGLHRCDMLSIDGINFHPGSTLGTIPRRKCIENIAESINIAHARTKKSIAIIENMCKQGNTVGGDLKEIRDIIDLVKDKSRVGFCIDTCHAFAAGYDLAKQSGFDKLVQDIDQIIGFNYLKGLHLNDSKGGCGDHLDRHELIGKGRIGIEGFRRIMNEARFAHLPMILETPGELPVWKKEIVTLYDLIQTKDD